jgi:DNA polymerase III subunit epsilon
MQVDPTAEEALRWLAARPVFLDTETTGLGPEAEICEIAVIDHQGRTLLNSLVKPRRPIPQEATDVHGICNADVDAAPQLPDLWGHLTFLLLVKPVVIYNADYDLRLIRQSAAAWDLTVPELHAGCAMKLYARFYGEWNDARGSYRWQRLIDAARQCGLPIPMNLHRAAADAELTRLLLRHMAEG